MSRDWTPKEWDMVHEADPNFRNLIKGLVWVTEDGEIPLTSEEEVEIYKSYPRLDLIGADFLKRCFNAGVFDTERGRKIVADVEKALDEDNYLTPKVRLWYEGKLVPGHYMDDNNDALFEIVKKEIENGKH